LPSGRGDIIDTAAKARGGWAWAIRSDREHGSIERGLGRSEIILLADLIKRYAT